MLKRKQRFKITLEENENYCILDKKATVIIFSDNKKDPHNTTLELILPSEEDMDGVEFSNALNLATAIATKLRHDPQFGKGMLTWFADFISDPENLTKPILQEQEN